MTDWRTDWRTDWLNGWLTDLLTPWNRIFLEELTFPEPVEKFSVCYGSRRYITEFTNIYLSCLYSVIWMQHTTSYHSSCRSLLVLSCHPRLSLQSDLFRKHFPTKILHVLLFSFRSATRLMHFILRRLTSRITLHVK